MIKLLNYKRVILTLTFTISIVGLLADGSTSNTIYVGQFLPYKTKEEPANRDLILENLKTELHLNVETLPYA